MRTSLIFGNGPEIDELPESFWLKAKRYARFLTTQAANGATYEKYDIWPDVYVCMHPELECTRVAIEKYRDIADLWVGRPRQWPIEFELQDVRPLNGRFCADSGQAAARLAIEEYGAEEVRLYGCSRKPGYIRLIDGYEPAVCYSDTQYRCAGISMWHTLADRYPHIKWVGLPERGA